MEISELETETQKILLRIETLKKDIELKSILKF